MLHNRLIPKLWDGLHLSQFTKKQCKEVDILINQTFLAHMGIHSPTKFAVVYGSVHCGGHAFINTQMLNDQANFMYMLQTLRWDDETVHDLIQTLDAFQIASGFVLPVMESTNTKINYDLGSGLLLHIRHRFGALDGSIWVEKAWQPELQHDHESSLVESFLHAPVTPHIQKHANECRIRLRVITIAKIA